MTQEKLQDAIGLIDEDIINHVDNLRNKKAKPRKFKIQTAFVAACVSVFILIGFTLALNLIWDNNNETNNAEIYSQENKNEVSLDNGENYSESEIVSKNEQTEIHILTVHIDQIFDEYILATVIDNSNFKKMNLGTKVKIYLPEKTEITKDKAVIEFDNYQLNEVAIIYANEIYLD